MAVLNGPVPVSRARYPYSTQGLKVILALCFVFSSVYSYPASRASASNLPPPVVMNNTRRNTRGELLTIALPVGQGDCTLIVCPEHNGHVIMIDAGSSDRVWTSSDVKGYLEEAKLNGDQTLMQRLTTIIVTHPDEDHFSYLPRIFPIGERTPSKFSSPSRQFGFPAHMTNNKRSVNRYHHSERDETWKRSPSSLRVFIGLTRDAYGSSGVKGGKIRQWLDDVNAMTFKGGQPCYERDCHQGNTWTDSVCGGQSSVRVEILAANLGSTKNEHSVAVRVKYGSRSSLLVGDLEGKGQAQLMDRLSSKLASDVYKISHHGSHIANPENWIRAIRPKMAFVSSAYAGKKLGHPRCTALQPILKASSMQRETKGHTLACGKPCRSNDGARVRIHVGNVHTRAQVYSTVPSNQHACVIQISWALSTTTVQPPQLFCWTHTRSSKSPRGRTLSLSADGECPAPGSGMSTRASAWQQGSMRLRAILDMIRQQHIDYD
ncbi:uncharacterized protein LOC135824532 [Sycon ciliatum]|uniref:uncharacterized protein LOC135824532 n=1 Tax=Sycon ciliatum TaxID=27933 RepID=UPI0031F67E9A